MKYIIYDSKHNVYYQGAHGIGGLPFACWGAKIDNAKPLTLRQANKLAAQHTEYEIQPRNQ